MGEAGHAEADRIPDLSLLEAAGIRTVYSYFRGHYRYDILVDNLLDLSHVDYLHVGSFSAGKAEHGELQVTEAGNDVIVNRFEKDASAPPFVPHAAGQRVDIYTQIHWRPGNVISFETKIHPAGQRDVPLARIDFGHVATPETENTTHYFLWFSRDYQIDDPAVDAQVAGMQVSVIQSEDGPMLEAVDAEMRGLELMEIRPVILPPDAGAMRVRLVMKRLLDREQSRKEAAPARPSAQQLSHTG
jgi:vanillate O-demethylase monooxygenase subunit